VRAVSAFNRIPVSAGFFNGIFSAAACTGTGPGREGLTGQVPGISGYMVHNKKQMILYSRYVRDILKNRTYISIFRKNVN